MCKNFCGCVTVPKGNHQNLYGFDKNENDTNFALAKEKEEVYCMTCKEQKQEGDKNWQRYQM